MVDRVVQAVAAVAAWRVVAVSVVDRVAMVLDVDVAYQAAVLRVVVAVVLYQLALSEHLSTAVGLVQWDYVEDVCSGALAPDWVFFLAPEHNYPRCPARSVLVVWWGLVVLLECFVGRSVWHVHLPSTDQRLSYR